MNKKLRKRRFDSSLFETLQYFDAESVYRYARIAKRTFYQAISDGRLRAYRAGGNGKLLVKREDLERFLTATPVAARLDRIADQVVKEVVGD
jgi:excisionase family DNA binding protein